MVFSHRFGWAFNHVGNEDEYVKLCAGFGSEGTTWIYANPEALVNAAITGVFTPTARWDYWSQPKEMRLASEAEQPLYDGACAMVS